MWHGRGNRGHAKNICSWRQSSITAAFRQRGKFTNKCVGSDAEAAMKAQSVRPNRAVETGGLESANVQCKADISNVKSPLHGLRFHDLRHHAITELVESQASERTIMAIAGHVSTRMLEHYNHIRMEAKRKALNALSRKSSTEGYGTKYDTKSPSTSVPFVEVNEKNGGDDETRTRYLCRDRAAF
jgi:hypothetical protein